MHIKTKRYVQLALYGMIPLNPWKESYPPFRDTYLPVRKVYGLFFQCNVRPLGYMTYAKSCSQHHSTYYWEVFHMGIHDCLHKHVSRYICGCTCRSAGGIWRRVLNALKAKPIWVCNANSHRAPSSGHFQCWKADMKYDSFGLVVFWHHFLLVTQGSDQPREFPQISSLLFWTVPLWWQYMQPRTVYNLTQITVVTLSYSIGSVSLYLLLLPKTRKALSRSS